MQERLPKGTNHMDVAMTVVTVLQLICALILIVFVLFQSGKHSGLGVIGGASDTFLSKNKARTMDAKLAKYTKWVAFLFMLFTLILCIL
jgi:preprotein translocase subunit SecG